MLTYALRELNRRKQRTIANILGYFIAISTLIIIINISFNSKKASDSILKGTGTHFIAYIPLCNNEECSKNVIDIEKQGFYANNDQTKVLYMDYIDIIKKSPYIADASPFLLFKFNSKTFRGGFKIGGVYSYDTISVQNNSCSATDIIDGRFFNPDDKKVIVLEQSFATANYIKTNSLITLSDKNYKVIGIVNPGIRPAKADIYMMFEDAKELINKQLMKPLNNEMNIILVESKSSKVHKEAMQEVKQILGLSTIISTYGCYKPASSVMGINETGIFIITIIIFFSILAFSLKSQYSAVIERKFEIGILLAIGWERSKIILQILLESIIQAILGWSVGSFIAILFLKLMPSNIFFGKNTNLIMHLYLEVLIFGLILSLTGGIIAGIFPALKAANQRPAECLRHL